MATRNANAVWSGDLKYGKGRLQLGSGRYGDDYTFGSRFGDSEGTNPEELIGAAHAGCFSMALAHELAQDGYDPQRVATSAAVRLEEDEGGFSITEISLETKAVVPGISPEDFRGKAEGAAANCPVSKALTGVRITVDAKLES